MTAVTHDIVAKLWNLCNVIKDDGVTYHQYVTELTTYGFQLQERSAIELWGYSHTTAPMARSTWSTSTYSMMSLYW